MVKQFVFIMRTFESDILTSLLDLCELYWWTRTFPDKLTICTIYIPTSHTVSQQFVCKKNIKLLLLNKNDNYFWIFRKTYNMWQHLTRICRHQLNAAECSRCLMHSFCNVLWLRSIQYGTISMNSFDAVSKYAIFSSDFRSF